MDNIEKQHIISNCPLCGDKSLHVLSLGDTENQQCISCGYVTSDGYKLNGDDADKNELYTQLTDEMREWAVKANDRIWIPTMMTLPVGMLYPSNDESKTMIWNFAPMVEIPEEERENFPNGQGGFYKHKYDTETPVQFEWFAKALDCANQIMKDNIENPGGCMPKLESLQ